MTDRLSPAAANAGAPMVNASRFRAAYQADWERLDDLLRRLEKRSVRALDEEEILALPSLYRQTLSSLSVARETSLDRALVTYLEQLSTRAYFQIYGVQTSARQQLRDFLMSGWPNAVRALWRETLVAFALTLAGAIAGYLLVQSDPAFFFSIIPEGLSGGRDPSASTEALRDTIYGESDTSFLTTFAAQLFTHNSQVAILAFALGFAFAVPTVLLLLYNGLMLGAMMAVFSQKGLGVGFAGWLSIHGTTELFAIILAGAAGMHIGTAIAFPGRDMRLEAAVQAGRRAATVMVGVVVMLLIAGLLEGIGRQIIQTDTMRYGIGLTMLLGWLSYYYLPRRGKTEREEAELRETGHGLASPQA